MERSAKYRSNDILDRYKSLTGFAICLTTRYKASPCEMPYGREKGIYIISNLRMQIYRFCETKISRCKATYRIEDISHPLGYIANSVKNLYRCGCVAIAI